MRMNVAKSYPAITTHEGAVAARITPYATLRRTVLSCLLWEDSFYESGEDVASRICALAMDERVRIGDLALLAIEARHVQHLRHAPLLLLRCLIKRGQGQALVSETIEKTITRADELAELVALYRADPSNKRMLPAQMKKGLAKAFVKFDEYQLAKYNRDAEFKLRDVLFLCHARPANEEQAALWRRLVDNQLTTPDTWEVSLSTGGDKKQTFTRMLQEGKLGYMALLRNLRNMVDAGVDRELVRDAIVARRGAARVLPFRYIAAARAAPSFEPALDQALLGSIEGSRKLEGETIVLVDVSISMRSKLSAKSDMTRMDAAAALASVINANARVFTFSSSLVEVPARRGMAGVQTVIESQVHHGTELAGALREINKLPHDRLIVITDEQCNSGRLEQPRAARAYMINVAHYQNGVGYGGGWIHLDGWSENVLRWIAESEEQ